MMDSNEESSDNDLMSGDDCRSRDSDDSGENVGYDYESDRVNDSEIERENEEDRGFINDDEDVDDSDTSGSAVAIAESQPIMRFVAHEACLLDNAPGVPACLQDAMSTWSQFRKRRGGQKVSYKLPPRGIGYRLNQPVNSFGRVSSALRRYLAPGCVEFDVNWCSLSVLLHLATKYAMPHNMIKTIKEAVEDRNTFREHVSRELVGSDAKVPAQFGGNRAAHGKDKLKFVSGYLSPVCYYTLLHRSSSETMSRLLDEVYSVWTMLFMIEYYGDLVDVNVSPFENLQLVYKHYTNIDERRENPELAQALSGLMLSEHLDGTPFYGKYNAPLELCLPEEMTYDARERFVGIATQSTSNIGVDIMGQISHDGGRTTPGFAATTCMFHDWFCQKITKRWPKKSKNGKYWPKNLNGLPIGAGNLGLLKLCGKVRVKRMSDPTAITRIMHGGAMVEVPKCILPSVISFHVQKHEAIVMAIADSVLQSYKWQRVAYMFDSILMRPPSGDQHVDVEEMVQNIGSRLDEAGYHTIKLTSEAYTSVTRVNRRRILSSSSDNDDNDWIIGTKETQRFTTSGTRRVVPSPSLSSEDSQASVNNDGDDDSDNNNTDTDERDNDDQNQPRRKRRKKSSAEIQADFRENVVNMLCKWADKHGAWRESSKTSHTDGVVIWYQIENTKAYTNLFKPSGTLHHTEISVSMFIVQAIKEFNNEWYEAEWGSGRIPEAWKLNIEAWMNKTDCDRFPLRPGTCRNRYTITAYKYGWVLSYKFIEFGEQGRRLSDLELEDVYVPYGNECVDPGTGCEPICTDTRHIECDFEVDAWPKIKVGDLKKCPVIQATLVTQIIKADPTRHVFTEEELKEIEVSMACIGAASMPGERPLGRIVVIEGVPGTGKSTLMGVVTNWLGNEEVATLTNVSNDSYQFGESIMINSSTGRCKHVLYHPDLEGQTIQSVCPSAKPLTTGEAVSFNVKNQRFPKTYNLSAFGYIDSVGRIHDQAIGVSFFVTNNALPGTKQRAGIGLHLPGYKRRVFMRRFNYVPAKVDARLEFISRKSMHWEIPYCMHVWGKIKKMMDTPRANGSYPPFGDLYPDENGVGIVDRRTNEFYEVLNSNGINEDPSVWIDEHLQKDPIKHVDRRKVYQKYEAYTRDQGRIALNQEEFVSLCESKGFKERSSRTRLMDACRTSWDEATLSYHKWSSVCCTNPRRKQKVALLMNCICV